MVGINQDIQSKMHENYDFFVVRCENCDMESPVVIYQDNLTGDEQLKHIKETTDYVMDLDNGGLLCQKCVTKEIVYVGLV